MRVFATGRLNLPARFRRLLQIVRGFANRGRDIFQHLANDGNLGLRFLPFLLIHVFTHRRDRLGPVTGVGAGSINLMLEPWALRQAFFGEKRPLNLNQLCI